MKIVTNKKVVSFILIFGLIGLIFLPAVSADEIAKKHSGEFDSHSPISFYANRAGGQNKIITLPCENFEQSENTLKWRAPEIEGLTLNHGHTIEISFAKEFRHRRINYVRVHFRKDPQYLVLNSQRIDENGAYLSLLCHNSEASSWHNWSDQFGSEKFATAGGPDNLNRNIFNSIQSLVGNYPIDKIRISNHGRGNHSLAIAQVHYIECAFLKSYDDPEKIGRTFSASHMFPGRVKFSFNEENGIPMKSGEIWELQLPQTVQGKPINYIIMRFRQDAEKIAQSMTRDPDPAYILVQALEKDSNLLWPWYDRYGTEKYVEPRTPDDPENENLHDCQSSMPGVQAKALIIENIGYGDPEKSIALLHSVEISFMADGSGANFKEMIFTPGTSFSHPEKGLILPVFAGGPRFGGKYPDSLMIGARRGFRQIYQNKTPFKHFFATTEPDPKDGFIDSLGRLHLFLPVGKKLRQIEISAGDVDNTVLEKNKDNHFGRLGWAELYCYIKSGFDGKMRLISEKVNVGPEGIIAISPDTGDVPIRPGDELVIESRLDVCFIMGIRLLLTSTD